MIERICPQTHGRPFPSQKNATVSKYGLVTKQCCSWTVLMSFMAVDIEFKDTTIQNAGERYQYATTKSLIISKKLYKASSIASFYVKMVDGLPVDEAEHTVWVQITVITCQISIHLNVMVIIFGHCPKMIRRLLTLPAVRSVRAL